MPTPPPRGGRTERHGLSSPIATSNTAADRRAKPDGVPRARPGLDPGWGCLSRAHTITPTRCVQRLRSAVARVALLVMADLSRRRISLPPRCVEGAAFDTG